MLGHYHPWAGLRWENRETIYPIKNWILFDGIKQTLPWRLLAIREIKAGNLPLWNRFNFSGTPLLANWQTAALYPLNFLFFILSELDAWAIYLFFQPLLAAIFAFYFLKDLFKNTMPAVLTGLSWGFSLILLNHLEFGIDGHTALWLPLGLLAINKLAQKFKLSWGLVLSGAVLLTLLAGYPPLAIYNLLLFSLYALFKIKPLISKKMILVIFFFSLGILLSTPQTLSAYQLGKKVIRHEKIFGQESGEVYFLPIKNLIMAFAPDFFGHPSTWNFFSEIYYVDHPGVGAAAFIFWVISLLMLFKKNIKKWLRREIIFWWLVVSIPVLLMTNLLFGNLLRSLPISFLAHVSPMKLMWLVSFGLSVLSGLAFGFLFELAKEKKERIFSFLILPLLLVLFFWILAFLIPPDRAKQIIACRNLVLPTAVSLMTTILIFVAKKKPRLLFLGQLAILVLAGSELLRQGWKYNSFIDRELIFPETKITKFINNENNRGKLLITNGELFPVNTNIIYQIPMIDGYASIRDSRYDYLARTAEGRFGLSNLTPFPRIIYQPSWESQIADLLGVEYVLSLSEINDSRLEFLLKEGQTYFYRNLKAFPKGFFVEDYLVENDLMAIADKLLTIDLSKMAILEEEINLGEMVSGDVEVKIYENNYLLLETINGRNGLLIFPDAYDQGWEAYIDGQKTKVLRADINLRGVVVPGGNHTVEFCYNPINFKLGLAISSSAFLLMTIFIFYHFLIKRKII